MDTRTWWYSSYFGARPVRIRTVSLAPGWSIATGCIRRVRAASFSIYLRYSSLVVAPIRWILPLASAGFSKLAASILPSAAPVPTTKCTSSIKRITRSSFSASLINDFRRSSNWPRYFVPATMAAKSTSRTRRFDRKSGTLPLAIRWASPSTTAVLPTPASPIRIGLFFVRRLIIVINRSISWSRPITGSNLPSLADLVRSVEYVSRVVVADLPPRPGEKRERQDSSWASSSSSKPSSGIDEPSRYLANSPDNLSISICWSDNNLTARERRWLRMAYRICAVPHRPWRISLANAIAISMVNSIALEKRIIDVPPATTTPGFISTSRRKVAISRLKSRKTLAPIEFSWLAMANNRWLVSISEDWLRWASTSAWRTAILALSVKRFSASIILIITNWHSTIKSASYSFLAIRQFWPKFIHPRQQCRLNNQSTATLAGHFALACQ